MTDGGRRRPDVSPEDAHDFLRSHLGPVEDVRALTGGANSRAFGFTFEGRALVLRVGYSDAGYRKDRFAHERFASARLPIPRTLEIGSLDAGRSFALSERADGRPLVERPREEIAEWLDAIFGVLRALHEATAPGNGFGPWDGVTGEASAPSFRAALLAQQPTRADSEPELIARVRERFRTLVPACPELRNVIHGDVSGFNLLGDRRRITALLDFGQSIHGEPAYDLAQLAYGLPQLELMPHFRAHLEVLGVDAHDLEERLLCYQLAICLGALCWGVATGRRELYRFSRERARRLLA